MRAWIGKRAKRKAARELQLRRHQEAMDRAQRHALVHGTLWCQVCDGPPLERIPLPVWDDRRNTR